MSGARRKGLRGPRLVNGEKRTEQIRATCTPTTYAQLDAIAAAMGLCRSRAVEAAVSLCFTMLEEGQAPATAADSWLRLLTANRDAMMAALEGLSEQIALVDGVVYAGGVQRVVEQSA